MFLYHERQVVKETSHNQTTQLFLIRFLHLHDVVLKHIALGQH
jgi:hypothetical protein